MATLIGGIAASHTPTIGFALDRESRESPTWGPIFSAFDPIREYLDREKPDVLVYVYNDHITSFFFDHYSAFSLGIGEHWEVADEGAGARAIPGIDGDPDFAAHLGRSLVADEFDMSFFQHRPLDHGVFSPLSMMLTHDQQQWAARLVPLQVGVLQFPVPSARRCYNLGKALRRAIESYPEDLRVAVVATGGLSHQVHGERGGFNNPEWDEEFLDLFESDPETLATLTQGQLAERGGLEGAEVIMWLIMRGALSNQVRCLHRSYYLPSMTGIATCIYESTNRPDAQALARHRAHVDEQLAGVEELQGTYPFTLERSVRGYRLNEFLHALIVPEHRALFLRDEEAAFEKAGLSTQERDLVRRRDWRGMIHHGVIFFMLEKLAAVIGVSNLHVYAAMRGESLEDFQKTRNTQAVYSVAGTDATDFSWEASPVPTQNASVTQNAPAPR